MEGTAGSWHLPSVPTGLGWEVPPSPPGLSILIKAGLETWPGVGMARQEPTAQTWEHSVFLAAHRNGKMGSSMVSYKTGGQWVEGGACQGQWCPLCLGSVSRHWELVGVQRQNLDLGLEVFVQGTGVLRL